MKTHSNTGLISYSMTAFPVLTRATSIPVRRVKRRIAKGNTYALALLLGLVVGAARPASAQYDPSAQFSPVANPNGVWSYGFESVPLGSPFNLLTVPAPVPAVPGPTIDSWQDPFFGAIGVFHNGTAVPQTVTTVGSEVSQFDPGMLAMNAGPNDQFAVVQFTAPVNGIYTFQGVFEGIDTAGTTSSVYLLENNLMVATGNIIPFGPPVPLSSGPFLLAAGQTLAYAVGGGPANSMTALINAQVAAVIPEPSTYALLGLALVPLVVRRGLARKRRGAIA